MISAWQRLPREARDTLFQLIVIAWTILPHASHLAFWCSGLALVVLLWRASISLKNAPLPSRAAVLTVMVIAGALTLWTEKTLLGKEAGVSMLVVLLALKTLEMRGRRDSLVVFFLGFFLVLTHCLYSQSLFTALAMVISTWGLLTAQVLSSMPVGKPPLKRAAAIALRTALLGLPVMATLFMLFPRIGPLWGLPQDAIGRTGLSSSMRLGGVAQVANDDSIAFRIRFLGEAPQPSTLYFRGPVLTGFDGSEWTAASHNPRAPARPTAALRLGGTLQPYEMLLEPIRLPLLPMLEATPPRTDAAPDLPGWQFHMDSDLRWQTDRLVIERLHLRATAWTQFEYGAQATPFQLRAALQLPADANPRALAWAKAQRARPGLDQADAETLAAMLTTHIRRENFAYTLQPGSYGRDAIDEFWFDRRQGFCEHFASSFVVMMRAMGVPARIVTGYQGADPPDTDGWRVVRQSNAHAWAEYWQAGIGWRRADPTAAVAPDRVASSRPLVPSPGLMAGALLGMNPALATQLRRAWELMDNRWNQWAMGYSRGRQFDLLQALGLHAPSLQDLAWVLLLTISAAAGAAAVWAWLDRRRVDPWVRLHRRIRAGLATLRIDSAAHDGPRALAEHVRHGLGAAAEPLAASLDALDELRYGRQGQHVPGKAWRREFERQLAQCRRQPLPPSKA